MTMGSFADIPAALAKLREEMPEAIKDMFSMTDKFRGDALEYIFSLPFADTANDLPNEDGIYFLLERSSNEIIYIGQSVNIKRRWKTRNDFAIDPGYRVYYLTSKCYFDLDTVEGLFIFSVAPRFNNGVRNHVRKNWRRV